MKKWKIPVTWEMYGEVLVESPTLKDAMTFINNDENIPSLPTVREYVDGSLRSIYNISGIEIVRELHNANQADE